MNSPDKTIQLTHVLDLSPQEAFTWWSQPEKLKRWSGCAECTHSDIEMDFRVGGTFRQTMDIAGKGAFTFHGIYDEIIEPERIAYRAFFGPVTTNVVVQFVLTGDKTTVTITQTGFPDERSLKTVQQGTEESLTALSSILANDSMQRRATETGEVP